MHVNIAKIIVNISRFQSAHVTLICITTIAAHTEKEGQKEKKKEKEGFNDATQFSCVCVLKSGEKEIHFMHATKYNN